jgi:hypothetical protein
MKYVTMVFIGLFAIIVSACGNTPPQIDSQSFVRPVAHTEVDGGPKVPAPVDPLCSLAPLQSIQSLIGGTTTAIESIQHPHAIECVYTNRQQLSQSMSILFTNSEQLFQSDNQWANAQAYFDELSYASTAVNDVGDLAAWDSAMERLLVLQGETVIEIQSATVDLGSQQVRDEIIDIGKQIISQIS